MKTTMLILKGKINWREIKNNEIFLQEFDSGNWAIGIKINFYTLIYLAQSKENTVHLGVICYEWVANYIRLDEISQKLFGGV